MNHFWGGVFFFTVIMGSAVINELLWWLEDWMKQTNLVIQQLLLVYKYVFFIRINSCLVADLSVCTWSNVMKTQAKLS